MQNDDFYVRLRRKKVIVATHVYGTGASQDLCRYFVEHKAKQVLYIGHPLFYDAHIKGSGFDLYESGRKIRDHYSVNRPIPLFVSYLLHIIKTIVWSCRAGYTWDLYVGSNNLNAFAGLLLRTFGRVKKVVYYVIDFNPKRYDAPLVNALYHRLDQYCVRHADETWNMSPRMETGRKKYFGFTGGNQKVVPVGLWLSESVSLPITEIHRYTLAFVGHVQEKQGIQYVMQSIPYIVKKIPDFKFLVIGGGDYLSVLQKLSTDLKVSEHVKFTGYVKNHADIEKLLAQSALAVALYDRYDGKKLSFSYFGNPTKVKAYLSAGLPVIMSDVPYNAKEIERVGCGKIVSYESRDIASAIIEILVNEKTLLSYRAHVVSYRKKFDWNRIFGAALANLP